jgi:hypothetical protein
LSAKKQVSRFRQVVDMPKIVSLTFISWWTALTTGAA